MTTLDTDSVATPVIDTDVVKEEVTNEQIAAKLDALGAQMDWLVTNLSSLFSFAQAMGQNGGGLRGLMKLMKTENPQLTEQENNSAG